MSCRTRMKRTNDKVRAKEHNDVDRPRVPESQRVSGQADSALGFVIRGD